MDRSQIAHFHLFQVGGLEFYNVVLAKLLGLRVVITAHDVRSFVESRSLPWLSRIVYMLSDRIIAQSDVSERELKSLLQQPETKIATIPHGNYVHAIEQVPTRQEARARLGLPQGVKVLLFFGQIKQVKGLDVLLRALPRVIEEQPDTVLLVAGKVWKDDFMLYQELIDSLNIANNCVLHVNFIPDSEVAAYYASADVVILPYRRIYQSGVLLMAMSYGKPVVVSDIEGMTEVVTDGVNGYVFHSGNAKALARKLIEVSSDLVEARRVGKNAFSYVREHHDWDEVGRATAACYQAVMEE